MGYLRIEDYTNVIRQTDLADILKNDTFIRAEVELAVREQMEVYLRHRYDLKRSFPEILPFSISDVYHENSLVEYTENAYVAATAYVVDDRVVYSGNIYKCTTNTTGTFNPAHWEFLVADKQLYFANKDGVGNYPTDAFSVTVSNVSLELDGWRPTDTLYFKREADRLRIYLSATDRTNGDNYVCEVEYDEKPLSIPSRRPVLPGINPDIEFTGYVTLLNTIADGATFEATSTGYFTKGDNRNPLIKRLMVKMCVYELHKVINPRNVPQMRIDDYNEALDLLKSFAKGDTTIDLPSYEKQESKGQRIQYGISSNRKYTW